MPEEVKPQIIETVAVSSNTGFASLTGAPKAPIAKFYERVISEAVAKAQEEGVTDPEEMRAIILRARDQAKAYVKKLLEENLPEG